MHHRVRRIDGGSDDLDNLELLHANCHRQRHSKQGGDETSCVSREALEDPRGHRRPSAGSVGASGWRYPA